LVGAAERDIEFSVTPEYVWDLFLSQNRKCALSGVDIELPKTSTGRQTGKWTASLDRKDGSRGYVQGNLQWIHKKLQFVKLKMSNDEHIEWCRKIAKYQDSIGNN
jgi:hypothetical protein